MAKKKKIANFSIFLDLREGCQKHEDKEKTSKDPSFEEKKFAERNLSSEWFQSLPERTSTPTANSFQWSPWSSVIDKPRKIKQHFKKNFEQLE